MLIASADPNLSAQPGTFAIVACVCILAGCAYVIVRNLVRDHRERDVLHRHLADRVQPQPRWGEPFSRAAHPSVYDRWASVREHEDERPSR